MVLWESFGFWGILFNIVFLFQDSSLVIERYKSGFSQPLEIPFEDLSNSDATSSVNGSTHSISGVPGTPGGMMPGSMEKKTILGTITGGRVKKRSGLLGLFGNNKVSKTCLILALSNLI
jgi:hypothetical protein